MLILLPPSETKRAGGTGRSLSLGRLKFPALTEARQLLADELVALSADEDASVAALKLGPKQRTEVEFNRTLWSSPTLPAIDRYAGVLYEGLDASSLGVNERRFAAKHLVVHAALFGPVGALDPIPAYRLSHNSAIPGLTLKRHWRTPTAETLAVAAGRKLVLDLRSEAYAELGPAPDTDRSYFLRVLTEESDGQQRALNHFNKKAKGEFTRAMIEAGRSFRTADELIDWATSAGWRLERRSSTPSRKTGQRSELALIVDQPH